MQRAGTLLNLGSGYLVYSTDTHLEKLKQMFVTLIMLLCKLQLKFPNISYNKLDQLRSRRRGW